MLKESSAIILKPHSQSSKSNTSKKKKTTSSFKEKVYDVVRKIKAGETLTYKEVAALVDSPRAYRAVGTVLGQNYDPEIPCHRVLRSDGGLGGYNRGLERKRELLTEEKITA